VAYPNYMVAGSMEPIQLKTYVKVGTLTVEPSLLNGVPQQILTEVTLERSI
jgi:hypothetical protein